LKIISKKLSAFFIFILLIMMMSGCYSVTIVNPGDTQVKRGIGIVKITLEQNPNLFMTNVKGLGFYSTPLGTGL
jgi:hypothetical protein